ncbi:Ubiquitin C-terminal hydrolase 13 [Linum perenne]
MGSFSPLCCQRCSIFVVILSLALVLSWIFWIYEQQVKRKGTKKFTWRIQNFSKLTETKVYSDTFVAGGHKWRVLVYPKGSKQQDYLSVYLDFADHLTIPSGWIVPADFSLTLVNQLNNGTSSVNYSNLSSCLSISSSIECGLGFYSYFANAL